MTTKLLRNIGSALLLLALTIVGNKSSAQSTVQVGSGTGTNSYFPLYTCYVYNYSQQVYWASELTAGGASGPSYISKIRFNPGSTVQPSSTWQNWELFLGNTTADGFATNTSWISGLTSVFSGTIPTPVANTWLEFTLPTPFYWDGVSNLVVGTYENTTGYYCTQSWLSYSATAPVTGNRGLLFYSDPTNPNPASPPAANVSQNTLAQIQFEMTPAVACSGTPNAGTAVAPAVMQCPNTPFQLSLSGSTAASGLTVQWQESLGGGVWNNITGATTKYYTVSSGASATTYYRAILTCTNSSLSDTSTEDTVTVAPLFPAGTYTINSASPTGGTNYQTFSDAVTAMQCGIAGPVVFNVSPGTYNEKITLPATINATATNTVTFNGNGATLTDSVATSGTNYATLRLDGADYITFKNLNIEAKGTQYGFAVHLSNGADWNTFDSCTMTANIAATFSTTGGVIMSGSPNSATTTGANGSNNVFSNSTISGGYYGMQFYGNNVTGNQNNDVINCKVQDFYFYGIYYYQNTGALVSQNIVERPNRTTLSSFYGIYASTGCTDMTIERNRIRNQFGGNPTYAGASYNIYVSSTAAAVGTENRVYNNLISNFNGNSSAYGMYLPSATNIQVYNNTVSIDNAAATAGTIYGLYSTGTTNVDIKNNIISITQGGTGTKYCIYFTNNTGKTSNYNNLYMGSTTGTNHIGYAAGIQSTFANWQAVNSNAYDQNGVSMDPMFAAPALGNHTPLNATFDNLGTPIAAITNDINGASRNATTPDIGAYEFSVSACSGPPTAGSTTINKDTTCLGATVDLGLVGNVFATGITYQWQTAASPSGPWTPIGTPQTLPAYLGATPTNVGYNYYRCELTCGVSTSYSLVDSVFVPTPFAGGTYTINPSGSGPNNFTSFNAAVSAMDCGISGPVVFNVSPGTYNEQVVLPASIGSTATNTVTFNGNGATLRDSLTTTGSNYATLSLNGADYITVKNLNIEANGLSYGFAVHLSNNADWNTFDSCTMSAQIAATSSFTGGVIMSGSTISATTVGGNGSNNVFSNSTISGGYYGMNFYGDAVANNQNNDVINCKVQDFYFYGIQYYNNTGALVSQNIVERPIRTTMSSFYGIYASTGCTDMTIERNRIRNQFGGNPTYSGASYNIYVSSTAAGVGTENRVYNNLISNFNGNSTAAGIYLPSATNIQVYNNTVSIDNAAATAGTIYGLYSTGTTNVDVKNNIISVTQGGTGTKYCLYFSGAGKTSNYNNLYMGSTTGTNNFVGYSNTPSISTYITLANWQGANSNAWDQNSVSMDPMFLSPATGDHTPINAMLDNLGTPIAAITNDINGASRSATTPDIGAYEFAVPPCVGTPSSAGTATASVDSTCVGGPVKLTLTGFPIAAGIGIQWEESFGANIWNPIIGATTATYTTALISSASYRAAVSCNFGTAVYSNVVNVTQQAMVACYCSPFTGQTLHSNYANYITNVSITGTSLNNPTSTVGLNGYTRNYPITANTSDTLTQLVNYTLNTSLTNATYDAIAWIDYDHNGTFDNGEDIAITSGVGTINIPVTALTGYTGMRIRAASNTTTYTSIDACVNAVNGYETEDYIIYIAPNIPCSGTPSTAGTASVNNDTLCVTGDVKLSLVNYPVILGIGLNWQWSPAGANTFTDIPGATTDTFTVLGLTASMDFRARVTCTNPGGGTTYSNVNTVTVINPQLLSTIPGARCGTGEVALFAKAAPGQQVNWYAASTGGAILSTGNVFITPSISTTTSYYAAASTGGGQPATVPMPTWGSNYSGNVRGFWFTAPANFTITSLTSLATTLGNQSIAVVKFTGNVPPPTYSTVTNAFTTLYLTQNNPAVGPISVNIPISAGEVIGIMAQTGGACSYGTPGGAYSSTIAGLPVTLTRMGMQYSLGTTAPMDIWQEPSGSIGTVAMTYVTGCEGTRTQVDATINPSGTGNLSTGGTVVGNLQANNTTVSYTTCNDTVAVINSGTTNMGATAAVVATPPTVQTFGGLPFVPRAYDIDPTTNGPATVTLYALQSEFTAYNSYVTSNSLGLPLLPTGPSDATGISHIVITQYHGDATAGTQGPFGLYSNANVEFIPNSAITVTPVGTTYWKMTFPVSGFSGFFIHSGTTPLDIKLASLAAANYGNRNRVDWTSADESHTSYYEIERSADAKAFAAVGRQTAKGKAGNYSYWDEAPLNGINYYRLKIYNANGNYSYSDVVKAFVSSGNAIMVEAYPNPVTDVLQVKVSGAQGADAHLLLTDIAGKVIRRIDMNSAATTLSMSGMANGLYLLKYVDNRHQQTIRVTKQ